jgi:hypothetical protein
MIGATGHRIPAGRVVDVGWRTLFGPPRSVFHGVLVLLGVGLLWVGTLPGVPIIPLVGLGWSLVAAAAVWTVKLVVYGVRRRRATAAPAGRWFLLAPVGGVLVVGLLVSGLAFGARWALSRASFDDAVAAVTDPDRTSDAASLAVDGYRGSGRLGLYRVLGEPRVIGDAVFFDHPLGGGFFDDAGFAYLPDGPTPAAEAAFEWLRTEPFDGPWHRWWSSW